MTERNIFDSLTSIDHELIEKAAPSDKALKKSNFTWIKWASLAAAVCLVAGLVIVPLLNNTKKDGENDRYRDHVIHSGEYGIVWPWEYKTVYEKYFSVDINGVEYIGRKRELPVSYVGDMLGTYKALGYDDTSDKEYHKNFDVYKIKGVSPERLVTVKMEEKYYVFMSDEYALPETWGEVLSEYSLLDNIHLDSFSVKEDGKNTVYRMLDDDGYIKNVLSTLANAERTDGADFHENNKNYLSFTITSEPLGVYKNALYITENGYLWTNIFNGEYLYYIGTDATDDIIKYAKENSTDAEFEPYNKTIAGKITEITNGYMILDDSVLCNDPDDGMTYKIILDDIRVSRYVDLDMIKVGSTVIVSYDGDIDVGNDNVINGIINISKGIISNGDILIPE